MHIGTYVCPCGNIHVGLYTCRVDSCLEGEDTNTWACMCGGCLHTHRMCISVGKDTCPRCMHVFVWEAPRPTWYAPTCTGAHGCGHVPQRPSNPLLPGLQPQPVSLPHLGAALAWAALSAWERWRSVVAGSAGCLVKSRLCPSVTVHSWASFISSPCLSFVVCKRGSQQHFISYKT